MAKYAAICEYFLNILFRRNRMKKMKRLLSAVLVLVLVASVFAGCVDSGKNESTNDPDSPSSGETGTYSVTVKSAGV